MFNELILFGKITIQQSKDTGKYYVEFKED